MLSDRRRRAAAVAAAAATLALVLTPSPAAPPADAAPGCDALCARVRSELSSFTDWLATNAAEGIIGEVGWPGTDPRWNAVADAWYRDADAARLWVTAWSTGEWWGTTYPLAVYEDRSSPPGIDTAQPQAAVVEAHRSTAGVMRGVNVAGGEFGAPVVDTTSSFSNVNRGAYDRAYHYDSQPTFDYLASRGAKVVRIPFRWERVQPTLGAGLDLEEVRRLKAVAGRARAAGMKVILDLHNYGGYYLHDAASGRGVRHAIGSAAVPVTRFADLWRRLSGYFKGNDAVLGYGLMNEPVDMPGRAKGWEQASQAAVDKIRTNGDGAVVFVSGYNWDGVQTFASVHPRKWIVDYSRRTRYEAHHYWDRDNSGDYPDPYDAELADAIARGFRPSS